MWLKPFRNTGLEQASLARAKNWGAETQMVIRGNSSEAARNMDKKKKGRKKEKQDDAEKVVEEDKECSTKELEEDF